MAEEIMYDKLRQDCWDKALDAFGFSFIFNKRMVKLRGRIRALTAFGIIVPVAAGSVALSYAYNRDIVNIAIAVATPLTIIQLIISLASLIYRWDDSLSYALEASSAHANLSEKFRKLGKTPPADYHDLEKKYNLIDVEYSERTKQDNKEGIREWELRMGMRAGLREFQRKCVGCQSVPLSLENSNCHVCGNYSLKYKYF